MESSALWGLKVGGLSLGSAIAHCMGLDIPSTSSLEDLVPLCQLRAPLTRGASRTCPPLRPPCPAHGLGSLAAPGVLPLRTVRGQICPHRPAFCGTSVQGRLLAPLLVPGLGTRWARTKRRQTEEPGKAPVFAVSGSKLHPVFPDTTNIPPSHLRVNRAKPRQSCDSHPVCWGLLFRNL